MRSDEYFGPFVKRQFEVMIMEPFIALGDDRRAAQRRFCSKAQLVNDQKVLAGELFLEPLQAAFIDMLRSIREPVMRRL